MVYNSYVIYQSLEAAQAVWEAVSYTHLTLPTT